MQSPEIGTIQRDSGFVLVVVVLLLAVLAGIGLHLLAESRLRLDAAQQRWTEDRLGIAAESAARRALQACADLTSDTADPRPPDPDRPHVLWEETGTDPTGIRVHVRLLDAQRLFDLNNLAPAEPGRSPAPEAVRIATALFRQWGDPSPGLRVEALARWMSARAEDPEASPPPAGWDDWVRHPEFGSDYGQSPALGRPGTADRGPVSSRLTMLPHPCEERPLPVNANTADRDTLRALLGQDHEAPLERLLARRREQPFRTPHEAASESGLAADRAVALEPWVTVQSEWFEVESAAATGKHRRTVRVLARRNADGHVSAVRWVRDASP